MAYQYDVFISYTRDNPTGPWVRNTFAPLIRDRLNLHLPEIPRIFVDTTELAPGTQWPDAIQQALLSSKILIPVWSAMFFRSQWCMCEWQTFVLRQGMLGPNSSNVIYPVTFADGLSFPPTAQATQSHNLSRWGTTAPAFAQSAAYIDFEHEVDLIAERIALLLQDANFPMHNPNWPIASIPQAPALANAPIRLPGM